MVYGTATVFKTGKDSLGMNIPKVVIASLGLEPKMVVQFDMNKTNVKSGVKAIKIEGKAFAKIESRGYERIN